METYLPYVRLPAKGNLLYDPGSSNVGCVTTQRSGMGREETYTHLWLIHADVWQKPTQYCKAIIFQLKIN